MSVFEWDPSKAATNVRKHGVGFEQALAAFDDRWNIERIDDREDYGEERIILIGIAGGALVTLCYVERGPRIRIISVRKATRREEQDYCHQRAP